MMKTTRYALTSALPAIAAVLALSSTNALAQEAQPVTVAPPSPVAADPVPVVETAPVTTTEAPVETTEPAAETSAPATTSAKRVTRTTAVKAAPARTVASTPAPARTAAAPVPVADPVQAMATKPAAQPVVAMSAEQSKPATTADAQPAKKDDTVPIAAGGALAFLALGGAAVAMTRRRRHEEEDAWVDEEPVELMAEPEAIAPREPIAEEQPLIMTPSAFGWAGDREATAAPASVDPTNEQDDRRPGESWVERAYRGPTANNPSVSLRNRLRRAAFFDKRERDVAAGTAEPVDMSAGLPSAMVDERDREFA
jgi:hypothetical protein